MKNSSSQDGWCHRRYSNRTPSQNKAKAMPLNQRVQWFCLIWIKFTGVSEKRTAFVFRLEEQALQAMKEVTKIKHSSWLSGATSQQTAGPHSHGREKLKSRSSSCSQGPATGLILSKMNQLHSPIQVYFKGFWRWCTALRISGFLDFVHRPVFYKVENNISETDLFPYSGEAGKTPTQLGPFERGNLNPVLTWGRKQIQFPKSCFLVSRMPDNGQSPKTH
jgi:hypothetical protein